MRLLFPAAMVLAATASAQPAAHSVPFKVGRTLVPGSECPAAASHIAEQVSGWRSAPLNPRKLTELPPADAYAAVYRLDAQGCMVPVMYRDVRPPRR